MIVYLERLEPLFDMDTGIGGRPTIHSLRNLDRSAFIDDGSGEERVWCDFGSAPTGSLLSMVKAAEYPTARQGRKRRTYDKPRTVYQRLLDLKALDTSGAPALARIHAGLNPAEITRGINTIQDQLVTRAKLRTHRGTPGISGAN